MAQTRVAEQGQTTEGPIIFRSAALWKEMLKKGKILSVIIGTWNHTGNDERKSLTADQNQNVTHESGSSFYHVLKLIKPA